MKSIFLITFFCSSLVASFAQKKNAIEIVEAAMRKAEVTGKNVFIKFGASWCGWCRKMDTAMADKKCKPLFDANYVIVKLVMMESDEKEKLNTPKTDSLIAKYFGDVKPDGLPYWFIITPNGKVLADGYIDIKESDGKNKKAMIGCPATADEVATFIEQLKASSKLTEAELTIISKRFIKNGR